MSDSNHPELHVNEEPSDDFMETGIGYMGMMTFIIVGSVIATIISIMIR